MSSELSPLGEQPVVPALSDLDARMVNDSLESLLNDTDLINLRGSLEVAKDRLLYCHIPEQTPLGLRSLRLFEFSHWGEYQRHVDIELYEYPLHLRQSPVAERILSFRGGSVYWVVEDEIRYSGDDKYAAISCLYDQDGSRLYTLLTDELGVFLELGNHTNFIDVYGYSDIVYSVGRYLVAVTPSLDLPSGLQLTKEAKTGSLEGSPYHVVTTWDTVSFPRALEAQALSDFGTAFSLLGPDQYTVRFPTQSTVSDEPSRSSYHLESWQEGWDSTSTTATAMWFLNSTAATIWCLEVGFENRGHVQTYQVPSLDHVIASDPFGSISVKPSPIYRIDEAIWTADFLVSGEYVAMRITSNLGDYIVVFIIEEDCLRPHRVFAATEMGIDLAYLEGAAGDVLYVTDWSGRVIRLNMTDGSMLSLELRVPEGLIHDP